MSAPKIICFGEVLWDLLPSGKVAGGAPMNVAFHLNQLGVNAGMISRVGTDAPGRELLAFLQEKGIPTGLIQSDPQYPTGTVHVSLDAAGHPAYEIVKPVAWDHIEVEATAETAVQAAEMLVYGSLVCRLPQSEASLKKLIAQARYRVLDVNLRQPYVAESLIRELLLTADLVKMNDEELNIITSWLNIGGEMPQRMASLVLRFDLQGLIVTLGAAGAAYADPAGYYQAPGITVDVRDTIGSGDAFLAGFLQQKRLGASPQHCLERACQLGAFVATQQGGTPIHPA